MLATSARDPDLAPFTGAVHVHAAFLVAPRRGEPSLGYLTPYGNFSYLRGDDVRENKPLDFISPFRTNVGFRWQNFGKSYYVDYNARIVSKQARLSEDFLEVNDGPEAGFVTHNLGGGYYFRRERYNFNVNLSVSNLFDRFYSEQFVFAPARGRSFTVGTSIEFK